MPDERDVLEHTAHRVRTVRIVRADQAADHRGLAVVDHDARVGFRSC